jgi:hypothetical protein
MKLIKADKGRFNFQIDPREKRVLLEILQLYPLIPPGSRQLAKDGARAEHQETLDDALAAQRRDHLRRVRALLADEGHFAEEESGIGFTLTAAQIEWLLQVLNDLRVGAWIALGSPDTSAKIIASLSEQTAKSFWVMEAAGHFQIGLLSALQSPAGPAAVE